jgi:hypothetical protein
VRLGGPIHCQRWGTIETMRFTLISKNPDLTIMTHLLPSSAVLSILLSAATCCQPTHYVQPFESLTPSHSRMFLLCVDIAYLLTSVRSVWQNVTLISVIGRRTGNDPVHLSRRRHSVHILRPGSLGELCQIVFRLVADMSTLGTHGSSWFCHASKARCATPRCRNRVESQCVSVHLCASVCLCVGVPMCL